MLVALASGTQAGKGTGFQPRGDQAQKQIYSIEHEDLCLIATAEITLAGLYADKLIPAQQLPIRMVWIFACKKLLTSRWFRLVCRTASVLKRAQLAKKAADYTVCTNSVRWKCLLSPRRSNRKRCTKNSLVPNFSSAICYW